MLVMIQSTGKIMRPILLSLLDRSLLYHGFVRLKIKIGLNLRVGVLMTTTLSAVAFWDVTPCISLRNFVNDLPDHTASYSILEAHTISTIGLHSK
jgi:hypothetical protein